MSRSPASSIQPILAEAALPGARANPFTLASADAETSFALWPSIPRVESDDVEARDEHTVEVVVRWGTSVLHVAHLAPTRPFVIGEGTREDGWVDWVLPAGVLGSSRHTLCREEHGTLRVYPPPRASSALELADGKRIEIDDAGAKASGLPLEPNAMAIFTFGAFEISVGLVPRGKHSPRAFFGTSRTELGYLGGSALFMASLLAVTAYLVPSLNGLGGEEDDQKQLYLIQQYLTSAQERETEPEPSAPAEETGSEGDEGSRAPAEEGATGSTTSRERNRKFAVAGPPDNPDPHLARERALAEASTFGMVSMLSRGALAGPLSPFGRDTALGVDELSAEGNMWGDALGESGGMGGLGLSGIGEGGGGPAGIIGLGEIGMGHGSGDCTKGPCDGFGRSGGRLAGTHRTKTPSVGMAGETRVSGRLPASTIQRIVRQNFGRMRLCYQDALSRNPNLEGRVAVRFVIGREGDVSSSQNGGSSLPDAGAVACVTRAFYGLSFPKPEGGIVTVVYPLAFSPA